MVNRPTVAIPILSVLLFVSLAGTQTADMAWANFMPFNVPAHSVEITSDGNVTGTDLIQHNGITYTFAGNVSGCIGV